ncbi:glycosyltransferase family 4 protein [Novosphingobium sp. JCM 18896]|uniref:glycosyltransferase family 4 protein n=1 Tax=Novosphingobium sp. JCM 18896 TaxID=2989731 RepID=UPI0022237D7C|nr:glycosyltransferase family 1 protein [Novosphingobium sp. JCM 18896]MCW1431477.1 glycosyltransferase family 4 protein [Novosphingobium sp. JCM 18896]
MIYINGRFLTRTVTGVERFAIEIVRALDATPDAESFCLLAPYGVARPDWLRNIGFATVGRLNGHAWEQIELFAAARRGALLNLCNSGPVLHPRSLVVLHDGWVFRHPDHFSRTYRLFHQTLDRVLAKRARIASVSQFSREELAAILALDPARVTVIPNAADHLDRIAPDPAITERLGLGGSRYLLMVGSFAPNKNIPMAIRAFLDCAKPDEQLVIVGAKVDVFANDTPSDLPGKVILAGRVSDRELAALYKGAHALVFPSIYEGFGIPPLEAMHLGIPVLASHIPVVREVCGESALYFDPRDQQAIAESMRRVFDDDHLHARLTSAARLRATGYSWQVSANRLTELSGTL